MFSKDVAGIPLLRKSHLSSRACRHGDFVLTGVIALVADVCDVIGINISTSLDVLTGVTVLLGVTALSGVTTPSGVADVAPDRIGLDIVFTTSSKKIKISSGFN